MAFRQTIVAGNAAPGSRDGNNLEAGFNNPHGIAINPTNGAIIVADTDNHCIRQIIDGVVSTIAGIGTRRLGDTGTGRIMGAGFVDGPDSVARFNSPRGVVVDSGGDIYVADCENHRIRRIMGGDVDTFAGNDRSQTTNGVGAAASFQSPCNLAFGRDDTLYVTDSQSNSIRMIDREGVVARLAGAALRGDENGRGTDARFREPAGIATNAMGVVFVADRNNCRIRRIRDGVVDTLAGSYARGRAVDGTGATAEFRGPTCLTIHPSTGNLLVIDDKLIRTVDPLTGVVTTLTRVDIPGIIRGIVVNRSGTIFLTVGNKIVEILSNAPPPATAAPSSGGQRSARRYKSRRSRRSKRSAHSKRTRKN
jgi:DNA-binding beta-propeller fold protein YncE